MRLPALKLSLICLLLFYFVPAFSQLGSITFDLQKDKPKKFENKVLKSEKTGDKKFTLKKRITQNTFSHYNYYFNANNKLNDVIEKAKIANKDDYGKLLPFYAYSLSATSAQKTELDSVIYKATAGILLHDLRSDWVDDLYLLIGKAYYFQKEFDSAGMTFQFINYNLFPHKKKDEFIPVVGTNANAGGNSISIANNENRSLINKTFTRAPSRNDALVWQIKTYVEAEEYTDAAGLINTLQNDQNFPSRLKADLEEVNAYWFFKQRIYDSTASHLEKALSAADDKQDKSRWEYLLAQLYEINKQPEKASAFYKKAMRHTTDPLLDIYANLNNAKIYKGNDPKEFNNTIDNLLRMAKKDKYESYRDIVYYSAGELALQKPDTAAAEFLFKKSISYFENNTAYKNRAYLQLGDIAFSQKNYKKASAFYDSLDVNDAVLIERAKEIVERKDALTKIVEKINIIEREDSLQHIAALSPNERETFIKDILKKLRKAQGLKEEDFGSSQSSSSVFNNNKGQSLDLFGNNNTKGDWYFYNASIKAKGFNEFKSRWGNRQNVDNWRRASATNNSINNFNTNNNLAVIDNKTSSNSNVLSYDALLGNLPLTPEKISTSNSLIGASLFELGKLYQNNLEDYGMAAQTYEASLQRFPNNLYNGELYMNLFYCYQKLGDQSKASFYKNLLVNNFKDTKYAQAVINPQALKQATKDPAATKRYESIYNLFIEGEFEKAVKDKKAADSLYGNNYWSPQLLYIESVYYIKEKQDSQAIVILNNIITQYPSSLLKDKASTMIDVLKRRKEIEGYLTALQVTRMKEDSVLTFDDEPKKIITQPKIEQPKKIITPEKKETVLPTPDAVKPQPITNGTFTFNADEPQNVIMILDKVDPVYISEARNAFNRYNREKFAAQPIDITKDVIEKDKSILIFSIFPDAASAIIYADRLKKNAPAEVSWLPANKYSFLIMSDANLQVLKANKDFQSYIKLLNVKYPGKF